MIFQIIKFFCFWKKRETVLRKRSLVQTVKECIPTKVKAIGRRDLRNGTIGQIALCRGDANKFLVGNLIQAGDVISVESAKEVLQKIISSQYKENVYKLPRLPEGIEIVSRAWVAFFDSHLFIGGTREEIRKIKVQEVREILRFPKAIVLLEKKSQRPGILSLAN